MKVTYWLGRVPELDDFGNKIEDIFIDGKTISHRWAIMSPGWFEIFGLGLGKGMGQKYQRQEDGRWLKIEG